MTAFEFLTKVIQERPTIAAPKWRYVGTGDGQGVPHVIALLDPLEAVTCSESHGWLGTPGDFVRQFELVKAVT